MHKTMKYKPCNLFANSNEEIYKEVVGIIKKRWKIDEGEINKINIGDHM